ncbi:hypothetical protein HKCCE4037_05225 [Rhodobacterales bacterium HKCCE4037]|nr:hypothetical protein [Rhodobacterales bacterium HKCCE4037]
MAKQSSSRSGSRNTRKSNKEESVSPDTVDTVTDAETVEPASDADSVEPTSDDTPDAGELGGDTVLVGDDTLGEDAVAAEPDAGDRVTIEPGDTTTSEGPTQTEIVDESTPSSETPDPAPTPVPVETRVERRGPGLGALLLGGVIAAALGYAAAYFGMLSNDTVETDPALTAALEQIEAQQGTIAGLEEQVAALAGAEPPAAPEVDFSGVETSIAGVAEDVAGVSSALEALSGRVAALEERPVFTGEIAADNAAIVEAVEALETRLNEERTAAEEAVAAAEAARAEATAEAQAAAEAAEAAIAEAQAEAEATAAATAARAAMGELQVAMATGEPFAEALAAMNADVPDALQAAAETGVPTLEELQAAFPDAARAALAEANRETAEDGVIGGLGAFLQNQLGGRSIEPREGDDPDAVLSRVGAAVEAGDLSTALTEVEALPPGARAEMDGWVAQVETRAAAEAAMADLAASLEN